MITPIFDGYRFRCDGCMKGKDVHDTNKITAKKVIIENGGNDAAFRPDMKYEQPTHIDLFSGLGGWPLAARWTGFKTIALCEIDEPLARFLEQEYPGATVHRDVLQMDGNQYSGKCNLLTASPPCQPFSFAGRRFGSLDPRDLWNETLRKVQDIKPDWAVFENVDGFVNMGLDRVLIDLEVLGYSGRTFAIPACAVNAPHRRTRIWIVANTHRKYDPWCGLRERGNGQQDRPEADHRHWSDADWAACPDQKARRIPKAGVCGLAYGTPQRLLRALGNGIVPQIAERILGTIIETERSIT